MNWNFWLGGFLARMKTHPGRIRITYELCTMDPFLIIKHHRLGVMFLIYR